MPVDIRLREIPPEDALSHIRRWLRGQLERQPRAGADSRRLQFSINAVIDELLEAEQHRHRAENPGGIVVYRRDPFPNSDSFQDAAWELCGRGIIRPALTRPDGQRTVFSGLDFVVTEYGERWLGASSPADVTPSESGRFAGMLGSFRDLLGEAFHARSQEALACYQAHAFLACCAMCGAAAEAVLLRVATERSGNREQVARSYRGANGRSRVEALVTNQLNGYLRSQLDEFLALLKYWRDDASHGAESRLSEQEAFMAMLLLLRFASFVHERWADFTAPGQQQSPA